MTKFMFKTTGKFKSRVSFACSVLAILLYVGCNRAPAPSEVAGALPNRMPPTSERAVMFRLDGDASVKTVSDYKGKVLVLDFWATNCPPCRAETPHLNAMQQQLGAKGLQVIGLNVGGADDKPLIADFVKQYSLTYPIGFPEIEMGQFYMGDDDRIPQTFVLDRNGKVIKHYVGFSPNIKADMEKTVNGALIN